MKRESDGGREGGGGGKGFGSTVRALCVSKRGGQVSSTCHLEFANDGTQGTIKQLDNELEISITHRN